MVWLITGRLGVGELFQCVEIAVVVNCDVIVCVFEPRDVFWDRFSRSCRVRVRKHGFRAGLFSVASRSNKAEL